LQGKAKANCNRINNNVLIRFEYLSVKCSKSINKFFLRQKLVELQLHKQSVLMSFILYNVNIVLFFFMFVTTIL